METTVTVKEYVYSLVLGVIGCHLENTSAIGCENVNGGGGGQILKSTDKSTF